MYLATAVELAGRSKWPKILKYLLQTFPKLNFVILEQYV